jgi:O-succinylbenzoate synthase
MTYDFSFKLYRRRFRRPLQTAHGEWTFREGIIIGLTDEQGAEGWGEIAPLPWFGSETLEQALVLCQGLKGKIGENAIANLGDRFPACQFAFESALDALKGINLPHIRRKFDFCELLPNGSEAIAYLTHSSARANSRANPTFKWKIGIDAITTEIDIFQKIMALIPKNAMIRLDANGGLILEQAQQWLEITEVYPCVEFLEQPLPPQEAENLLFLSENYPTPLALDEAIASLGQLQAWCDRSWPGIYVIKAAIIGSPSKLRQICAKNSMDMVFSSVFETKIGRQALLGLAAELATGDRALGLGVDHWLVEEEEER